MLLSKKVDQLENCDIQKRLSTLEGKYEASQPLTRRKSPVELTEAGEKVLTDSGGKKLIDDNYQEFKKFVLDKEPETSYDKQEYSKELIKSLENDVRMAHLRL